MSKYFWGNDPMDVKMALGGAVWGSTLNTILIAAQGGKAGYMLDLGLKRSQLLPLAGVTVGFAVLHTYACFMPVVNMFSGAKSTDSANHIISRIGGNMMEWEPTFLSLLWTYGIFINPEIAAYTGAGWCLSRFLYPLFYAYYGQFTMFVELSTQPQYNCYYFWCMEIVAGLLGCSVAKKVCEKSPYYMFPVLLGLHLACQGSMFTIAAGWAKYIRDCCASEESAQAV